MIGLRVRVFVAGGSGVLGRRLVPPSSWPGCHQVTATTTSRHRVGLLEGLGARAVVMDGLDAASVGETVAAARPDAVFHQMTAIASGHAGQPDIKRFDTWFAPTIRLRTEGFAAHKHTLRPDRVPIGFRPLLRVGAACPIAPSRTGRRGGRHRSASATAGAVHRSR